MVHWAGDTPQKKNTTHNIWTLPRLQGQVPTYLGRVTSSNTPPSSSRRESMMVNDDDDDDNASCFYLQATVLSTVPILPWTFDPSFTVK